MRKVSFDTQHVGDIVERDLVHGRAEFEEKRERLSTIPSAPNIQWWQLRSNLANASRGSQDSFTVF